MTIHLRCTCGATQEMAETVAVRIMPNRPVGCFRATTNTCDACRSSKVEELGWECGA